MKYLIIKLGDWSKQIREDSQKIKTYTRILILGHQSPLCWVTEVLK